MNELQDEHTLTCPYCWSQWTVLIDLSIPSQIYIEDCAICCNPVTISYRSDQGELLEISAERSQ